MAAETKVAIITGAGRGIGEAIARQFAKARYRLILTSTDGASAQKVADDLGTTTDVRATAGNLADPAQAASTVEFALKTFGKVDVLVNNGGTPSLQKFLDITPEEWDRVLAINLKGSMLTAQAAARDMLKRKWGRIINIASVAGFRALGGRTSYGSSKAGLLQMTRQIAVELAPFGITVNAIAPGVVETDMTRSVHTAVMREAFCRNIPIGRYAEPDEIASAAEYLASESASYVTGQALVVDGGVTAALAYAGTGLG
jgi:NAD(P)-dependent dehydrogenase (short-subunit alcohol dehydrogenase family)